MTATTPTADASAPIGVFDSGVGGLSVLREIRKLLPHENLLYVADSAHIPYGDKSARFIEGRSLAITEFLLNRGAKAIVVACNTASGAAVATLRTRFAVPIVAMEPAIKPAMQLTRSGVVGVLATSRTLASEKFTSLLSRFGRGAKVHLQPCSGLVERVESGALSDGDTRALLEQYLQPLLRRGADTIVLGCTHYPFLRPLIETIAGPEVTIVDPSPAVARELRRRLETLALLTRNEQTGSETFWTSGAPDSVSGVISTLWEKSVVVAALPDPILQEGTVSAT